MKRFSLSRATLMFAMATMLFFGLTAMSSATVIDDFSDPQAAIVVGGAGGFGSSQVNGSMLGGWRTINVLVPAPQGATLPTEASARVDSGFLVLANGPEVASTVEVIWAGFNGTGLDPVGNLSSTIGILIQVAFLDLTLEIALELEDGWGNVATRTQQISATPSPGNSYLFNFNDFNSVPGAIDLGNLTSVKMTVTGDDAYDAFISFVDTTPIPEPSTLLLSGLALLGLGLLRRRQTKA